MDNTLTIIRLLATSGPQKPGYIAQTLGINKVTMYKFLRQGMDQGYITKSGLTPHVFYNVTELVYMNHVIARPTHIISSDMHRDFSVNDQKILETFFKIDAMGTKLLGKQGFHLWCVQRNVDPLVAAQRYISLKKSIDMMKNEAGLIDVTSPFGDGLMKKHRQSLFIDTMYYCDRYNYDDFGRGPLAERTFFAKQAQDLHLMKSVIDEIVDSIAYIVYHSQIDAIAITPWSIERNHQLLAVLQNRLIFLNKPFIDLYKYYPDGIPIAQKTLKGSQRFVNALNTIHVRPGICYDCVLLIDDFVGSGATMNISAMKLKGVGVTKSVIGLAIVGNIDMTYDVINEI